MIDLEAPRQQRTAQHACHHVYLDDHTVEMAGGVFDSIGAQNGIEHAPVARETGDSDLSDGQQLIDPGLEVIEQGNGDPSPDLKQGDYQHAQGKDHQQGSENQSKQ